MSTWIALDVSALAYRSFYTTGFMQYKGIDVGAIYGIFKTAIDMLDEHGGSIVWCLDRATTKRKALDSRYKANRTEEYDPEKEEIRKAIREQTRALVKEYLPAMGCRNVLWKNGYEGDDMVGLVVEWVRRYNLEAASYPDDVIIVSVDQDLWQLLGDDVRYWNPIKKKMLTAEWFTKEWGIKPSQWVDVKALAGCKGDNVIGIAGIGEKTAAKYLRGEVKEGTKTHEKLINGKEVWEKNIPLVRLPFESNIMPLNLRDEQPKWGPTLKKLGMRTLL